MRPQLGFQSLEKTDYIGGSAHVIARACGAVVTNSNGDLVPKNLESQFIRPVISYVNGGRVWRKILQNLQNCRGLSCNFSGKYFPNPVSL